VSRAKTKRALVIEVWSQLGCESAGARELEHIQQAIVQSFGQGAVESPASIARMLADEGVLLRHPEVLDCDTRWRQRLSLDSLFPEQPSFLSLTEAADTIERLDGLRKEFEEMGDDVGLVRLRELALKFKRERQLLTRSKTAGEKKRLEAQEMVQWLNIWLQHADIFPEWLSLRRRSPEFIAQFGQ
jgi:hypothetical protein